MKTKNIIPLTEARRRIFSITKEVQRADSQIVLTQHGNAKAVIISAERFERLIKRSNNCAVADRSSDAYGSRHVFPGTLVIRDDSRVVYLSGHDQELKKKEEDLIKAQLFVKLIENHGYSVRLMELARYVRVGGRDSRHYVEADILVNDNHGNVISIFEVSAFSGYEENMDSVVADLFSLAQALSWSKKPENLVYYSRKYANGRAQEKISVIDYCKFNTFAAWKRAGKPCCEKIPSYPC